MTSHFNFVRKLLSCRYNLIQTNTLVFFGTATSRADVIRVMDGSSAESSVVIYLSDKYILSEKEGERLSRSYQRYASKQGNNISLWFYSGMCITYYIHT